MAIIGVGIDIAQISRIAGAVDRHGARFVRRVYTPLEADFCGGGGAASGSRFAGRWAAKEAFYKALPPEVQPFASWLSVQILPDGASGRPRLEVCGERLKLALSEAGISFIHLSITHERTHCAAVAVLE
jgi:holo-[acyl-carrier protein] synthase